MVKTTVPTVSMIKEMRTSQLRSQRNKMVKAFSSFDNGDRFNQLHLVKAVGKIQAELDKREKNKTGRMELRFCMENSDLTTDA